MPMPDPAVIVLGDGEAGLGARIADACGGRVHRPGRGAVAEEVRALFLGGVPVVGVCAAGILIRALGPVLGDKRAEPPVLAVAADGRSVVPLLGGHRGANALATRIAAVLDGAAAVTTAGDAVLGVALDAPPPGWRLETPEAAKGAMAALLAGARATLSGRADWLAPLGAAPAGAADGPVVLQVDGAEPLIYRRQDIALGVGCERGVDADALIGHVGRALAEAGLAAGAVAGVYSLDLKADEAAVHALARHLGVEARFFDAARLEAEAPRLTAPSEAVFREVGCHGVAEGAALAAAGPGGALILPKQTGARVTCAAARLGPAPEQGCPRGRLSVVGIGPGRADWRTPEATRAIAEAEEVVGYQLYLDLLGPLAAGKARTRFALGEEEARCRHALEAAGAGRRVALVSSGDAGIFAMGALVAELLDRAPAAGGVSAAARRVEVVNVPGISALQAASARAGALLGHDFCAISLSDLLTPRAAILKRLQAAAEGDFVIAFYNPVSRRRRTLLAEAREILLAHRPPGTPVLLAVNLGRDGERLARRTLATLSVEEVDMLTVVLVGSSESRAVLSGDRAAGAEGAWLYTPRGYAAKAGG